MRTKIAIYLLLLTFIMSCKKEEVKYIRKNDRISLLYKIKLSDGCRIDESFFHNNWNDFSDEELFAFTVGEQAVIKYWDSAIIGCRTDSLYTIKVPYSQAYDTIPVYHDIPAKSDLYIQFKIIDILQ